MGSRAWIITHYIQTTENASEIDALWKPDFMKYMTGQLEECPTTGRIHFQGAILLQRPMRLPGLKKRLPGSPHLEPSSSIEKIAAYCTKEATRVRGPWTWGELKGQGHRTDIHQCVAAIQKGAKIVDLAKEFPTVILKYPKGLQLLAQNARKRKTGYEKLDVYIFWGATGTGKTRAVWDMVDHKEIYATFDVRTPWFDHYDDEAVVLLDECGPGMMNINMFKRITDGYPMLVPIKGGTAHWNPKIIVCTSNQPLHMWWPQADDKDFEAIMRRAKVYEFPDQKDQGYEALRDSIRRLPTRRSEEEPEKRDRVSTEED